MNTRAIAARILTSVIRDHHSLNEAFENHITKSLPSREQALVKEFCYGTLRWYFRLKAISQTLIYKPLKPQYQDIDCLLILGLYQLIYLNTPPHAAVSETVGAAQTLKKPWAKGLLNQALHQFINNQTDRLSAADKTLAGEYAHPPWIIQAMQKAWPKNWTCILEANNSKAPLYLRVNPRQISRADYLLLLQQQQIEAQAIEDLPQALVLGKAQTVETLPGFMQGYCSVQDLASQYIIELLACAPGQRVLDACAAPGGKTCHLLETQPELMELLAIDQNQNRVQRIEENIQRLKLSRKNLSLKVADASQPSQWWDGRPFDRILIDAPCSSTGVIRRHPDIKILRLATDIKTYAQQQRELLDHLWPLLAKGGKLLYTTCSVFPEENEQVTLAFCQKHSDAKPLPINIKIGEAQEIGHQLWPNPQGSDGFYFALFTKF